MSDSPNEVINSSEEIVDNKQSNESRRARKSMPNFIRLFANLE
mgnify:CR=1 FL=1